MRMLAALLLLLTPAAAAAQTGPSPTPIYGYEVVRAYPHDPAAFTQGLIIRDGVLFESTGRFPSTVRKVRLEDGVVLARRELDRAYFGEGLTDLGDRIVSVTWRNRTGFLWNASDLGPQGEFAYAGEGWGLTDDGERLILSDGTPVLRFLDPATMAETGRVTVTLEGRPVSQINELEWVEGEVFANVWKSDLILRIDPVSGAVRGVINLAGLIPPRTGPDAGDEVLNGIAWDATARRLFVTGKHWPTLFEIRLTERTAP